MREFLVTLCMSACLIGACCQEESGDGDKVYPQEVYNDANLGSIVMMDDSIAVIFFRVGFNESSAKVVNIHDNPELLED